MRPSSRPLAALATIVTGVGLGAFALAPAAQADTNTLTYFYSGVEQTFHIPPNVLRVHVDASSGRGGDSLDPNANPDPGGSRMLVSAWVDVTPDTDLFVEVGGDGQNGASHNAAGGWNGGGDGSASGGAGGGGASDVRTTSSSQAGTLPSRLVVAGGGGGAAVGGPGGAHDSNGGAADSVCETPGGPGGSGNSGGAGGSPGNPGPGAGQGGGAGSGGAGGSIDSAQRGGGGGGGGYVGGGGGGAGTFPDCAGGGGGGSTFVTSGGTYTPPGADFGNRSWITISYVLPLKPLVTTTPASDIGQTSATLNGVLTPETVTPPDAGALCYFEYGLDTSYGTLTDYGPCGAGMDQVYFGITASPLLPGTMYHFRLVASNRYGFSSANDQSFTTLSAPPTPAPTATTSPATNVGQHKATMHGVVNPEGYATTYHFDYGKTLSYGKSTANRSAGNGTSNMNVQAALANLPRHTTYHFRVVAVNVNGTTEGADKTFRTG
jgi:hypothetical protein